MTVKLTCYQDLSRRRTSGLCRSANATRASGSATVKGILACECGEEGGRGGECRAEAEMVGVGGDLDGKRRRGTCTTSDIHWRHLQDACIMRGVFWKKDISIDYLTCSGQGT